MMEEPYWIVVIAVWIVSAAIVLAGTPAGRWAHREPLLAPLHAPVWDRIKGLVDAVGVLLADRFDRWWLDWHSPFSDLDGTFEYAPGDPTMRCTGPHRENMPEWPCSEWTRTFNRMTARHEARKAVGSRS
jgi:hypothetical protein